MILLKFCSVLVNYSILMPIMFNYHYSSLCSVRSDLIRVQSLIGYCPQFDALIGTMSGKEHLEYYARVRGLSKEDERNVWINRHLKITKVLAVLPHSTSLSYINNVVQLVRWLLRKLDVYIHRHKPTQHYSGGTRRKLSTALALVGRPALIFLDEPTTGMDPGAKRFLWDAIRSLQRDLHCTVVLTTHRFLIIVKLIETNSLFVKNFYCEINMATNLGNLYVLIYTLIINNQ